MADYPGYELHKPLNEGMPAQQMGSKYYIKSEPTCCLCYKHRTTISRSWGAAPVLQMEETCGDCILNNSFACVPIICCGGLKYTVSGMVNGDANLNPCMNSSRFSASGMPGVVGIDSRIGTRLLSVGWKSLCCRWIFTTNGGTVDYFTANGESAQDMLHIHRATTTKAQTCWCGCASLYMCVSNWCVRDPMTCCPGGYAATTEVKGGDRLAPGGPPTVGTLSSGIEKPCCLTCLPCKAKGGVITVPQELDANTLMSWALLWNTSLQHHMYKPIFRKEYLKNWSERPMGRVEEMM